LAWAHSLDEWDESWPEETKRAAVQSSISVHRKKGTLGAVRRALAAAGYGDATIVEGYDAVRYDGSASYNGAETHGAPDHWAEYRVYIDRPITVDQVEQIKRICRAVAPARCRLAEVYYPEAAHRYDGSIAYDGTRLYGGFATPPDPEPAPLQRGLTGWYDASNAATLTIGAGNTVTAIANRTGGEALVAGAGGGPVYDPANAVANGNPALVWPNANSNLGLQLGADTPCGELFMVMAYQDGLSAAFATWTAFFGADAGRQIGRNGRREIYHTTIFLSRASINGGPEVAAVLPLPLAVVRFSGTFRGPNEAPTPPGQFPLRYLGDTTSTTAWRGPICEVLTYAPGVAMTETEAQENVDYLQQKWGIS